MLCAEKARQCSSCSATAQLNIAPLVSNRPEILQSAAAIILTLLIQFVSATHRSVPELLRQHSYTVHDLVSCLSLSSQLKMVDLCRVWMLSRRLCCATRRSWRRWWPRPAGEASLSAAHPRPSCSWFRSSPRGRARRLRWWCSSLRSSATDNLRLHQNPHRKLVNSTHLHSNDKL